MSGGRVGFWLLAAGGAVLCGTALFGQSLTISQAVEGALRNYPAIRVSQEQINAAAAGIQLARTAYLPRVDLLAQANRATRNNVFGLLLPQNVIPSMSGPVIGSNNFGTAWGSAAGILVSWEPFDFGLRSANVAAAAAVRTEAEATLQRTRYDVAVATADAYLTLAATEETVGAAHAAVDRAETILRTIQALVNAGLRPGADASRAQAELAAARTQWIQAKQATEVARSTVSQFVGMEPNLITLAAPKLLELPPAEDSAPLDSKANPIAIEQDAVLERAKAQLRALERSYFPRFSLQGSAYARGTGAEMNGALLGGLNGLAPSVQDYALGFTVTFPAMDLPAIQARRAAQSATVRAENARYQQIATDLKARWNAATARVRGAREVVANTPIQVGAARAALQQSTARYQSGLANIDEVAEAQRLLTQAEIDDALARLSVWRGLLEIATVAGDLEPFLAEASQ
jgi:outer membrane protein